MFYFYRKIFFFILLFSILFSIDNLRHIKNITSLLSTTSIQSLNDTYLLISSHGGIYKIDYDGLDISDYTDNLKYVDINTISIHNDKIWLGGNDGNVQILESDLDLNTIIDYIPFSSIKKIIFYGDYAFAIAFHEGRDVVVQYSSGDNPNYLNYFSFDNFIIEAENNPWYSINQIINAVTIYDIFIQNNIMYLGTNEGLLQADLSMYNNNLLLLLDWRLEDPITDVVSFVEGYDEYPIYIVTEEGSSGFNINQSQTLGLNPLDIIIQASNGASDYGNKVGEPIIHGFTSSYNDINYEFLKPIMFSAGLSKIYDMHLYKKPINIGDKIIIFGGPAYKIGLGGLEKSKLNFLKKKFKNIEFYSLKKENFFKKIDLDSIIIFTD